MDAATFFKSLFSQWRADPERPATPAQWMAFALSGLAVGLASGAIIALFRIGTNEAVAWARTAAHTLLVQHELSWGVLLYWFGAFAGLALLTGLLVRDDWAIHSGGMPWDLRALHIGYPHPWRTILLPKFIGSFFVMAAGVSVGREGPSIQMGAATALGMKEKGGDRLPDRRLFVLGGCAAGLASAFSAPVGGVCFIFERMKEKITGPLLLFAALAGVGVYVSAVLIFRLDYLLPLPGARLPSLTQCWIMVPLGLVAGLVGVAYSKLLALSLALYDRTTPLPVMARPLFPFLGAALLLFFYPMTTGEGMFVVKGLEGGGFPVWPIFLFLGIKLLFTAFCFGSGIPAGRMVPIFVLGGVTGALYASLMSSWGLLTPDCLGGCIIMGMGGAFAASERSPVTGTALALEMTGAYVMLPAIAVTSAIGAVLGRLAKVQ